MSLDDFGLLCPALLHQIDDGVCLVHAVTRDTRGQRGTVCRRLTVDELVGVGGSSEKGAGFS